MGASIREAYDICSKIGGLVVAMDCSADIKARIQRAGSSSEDYTIEVNPARSVGGEHAFSFPISLYGFPVGYYDFNIYDGELFKKTIRLNLHTTGLSGRTSVVETDCPEDRTVAPNVQIPVECPDVDDPICPEPCLVEVTVSEFSSQISSPPSFKSTEPTDEAKREAKILHDSLISKLSTPKGVYFYFDYQEEAIADYFDSKFKIELNA